MKPKVLELARKVGYSLACINMIFKYIFFYNNKFSPLLHFTSRVRNPNKIKINENDSIDLYRCLAESPSIYIQALSGIELNSCLNLAPGVKIISSNHDSKDLSKHIVGSPIIIGRHVWIGANSIILPNVIIGDNVTIGAGSVVTKDIPSNSIAVGNPCRVIKNVCN